MKKIYIKNNTKYTLSINIQFGFPLKRLNPGDNRF